MFLTFSTIVFAVVALVAVQQKVFKDCVEENQVALEEFPKNTIAKLWKCVQTEIDKVQDLIEGAIADIIKIKNSVVDLTGKCIVSSLPSKCVRNLIDDIVGAISSVRELINSKINEVVKLVMNAPGNVMICAALKVVEATAEAAFIGAKVVKCVADKISRSYITSN